MISKSRAVSVSFRALVGSSMMMIRASKARALAISIICRTETGKSASGSVREMSRPSRSEDLAGLAALRGEVRSRAAGGDLAAEEDVVDHVHRQDERGVLVDGRDSPPGGVVRRTESHRPALELDLSRVLGMDSGEDLDQRRLSRAVLAGQDMDFPGAEVPGDVFEHGPAPERFSDPIHPQDFHGPTLTGLTKHVKAE